MAAPYNTLNVTDTTNFYTLFGYVNHAVTGGLFMPVMLLVIWLVAFIGSISEGRPASRGFIFASFICSILSIMMALIGFLSSQYMYFSFLLVGAGLIWYKLDQAPGI